MTENFPVFYIPAGADFSKDVSGPVVLYGSDWKTIGASLELYGENVIGCYYSGKELTSKVTEDHPKVLFRINIDDVREAVKTSSALKADNVIAWVQHSKTFFNDIKTVSSVRIKTDILAELPKVSDEDLEQLFEYFFHNRSLHVPIEPFARLVHSYIMQVPLSLWELHRHNIQRFVWVDADGNVSNSLAHLEAKQFAGTVKDDLETWKASDVAKSQATHMEKLIHTHPKCQECMHLPMCRGFAKFEVDTCERWTSILDTIVGAAKSIQQLRNELAEEEKRAHDQDRARAAATNKQ